MNLEVIFKNNERWIAEKLSGNPDYFNELAKGQAPELLYIGCSDSRVTSEDLMGMKPGQVFVHRNVANQVISTDNNVNAVIQYAVEFLKVKHIIVCGHYECGGIRAAMTQTDMGQINSWLQTLKDIRRFYKDELDAIKDERKKYDRLVELNVHEQCINIIKTDHVQKSWQKNKFPKVHSWVFDVRTGRLIDLRFNMEKEFMKIKDIYNLQIQ